MGDVGDYWNEHREHKRRVRSHWHECPNCAVRFGTGTSVAPGEKCRNCDWVAPGERGEDLRAAGRERSRDDRAERSCRVQAQKRNAALRCPKCGKKLKSKEGRDQHLRDKHGAGADG